MTPDTGANATNEPVPHRPDIAKYLIYRAISWELFSIGEAILGGLVGGVAAASAGYGHTAMPGIIGAYCGVIGTACVLFYGALRPSRAIGGAGRSASLALNAIERPPLFLVLAVAMVVYAVLLKVGINAYWPTVVQAELQQPLAIRPLSFLAIVVAAPMGEELFFRGWLWTALRQVRGPLFTGLAAVGLWIVLHLPDGLLQVGSARFAFPGFSSAWRGTTATAHGRAWRCI
jgi:membrane protease YdiL (CAAX protease family)